ncbi:MAG: monovalent cation/H+ antiporter subunit A [Pseudomonadota bacterium]
MGVPEPTLALIASLPFVGALFPGLMIRAGRTACAASAGVATLSALILMLTLSPSVFSGDVLIAQIVWMPQIGLDATFRLDGLAWMFGVMILGIGLLIQLYARYYLSSNDPAGQFYTYLMLFQGAMLGIVLSDNILLLLVFWELTSLSSFLLIGYWRHLPDGRQGARMALTVTGMGGLALIAGMLMLGQAAGSYELTEILANKDAVQSSPLYVPALLCILLGCFTKSAQFPFQFWLPHAMAAPTPVSAYLHSATMVKAGIFLMARLWPVLAGTEIWFYIVATTGLVTMVIGAAIAIFKDDLKALLAFSTVSHLGFITMLLGFGTAEAAGVAILHIVNHVTFKAALFMTAGIVDHEAHTRDIKRLGGLLRLMPITAVIATLSALSMAGVMPLNGFYSKEYMLEQTTLFTWAGLPWFLPVLATFGALLSVTYSFRYIVHVFLGPVRTDYPHKPHDPPFGMWAAPAFLTVLVVVVGLFPNLTVVPIREVATGAVTNGAFDEHGIKLWYGVTPAFVMSVIAIAGGAVALALYRPLSAAWAAIGVFHAKDAFDWVIDRIVGAARGLTATLHDGALSRYLAIFAATTLGTGALAFFSFPLAAGARGIQPISLPALVGWGLLVAGTIALTLMHRRRLLMLVFVGIVGLMVSLLFVQLSAPDLAMTQISVEVVSIILLLLALNFLPRACPEQDPLPRRVRDGTIAVLGGLAVAALTFVLTTRDFDTISGYYVDNSKTGGGGTNMVNVILVDFRGYDTFGEIIVLGIAALTIFALVEALLDGRASRKLANWTHEVAFSSDRHPLMMVVATRMILPITLMVGVYIFLRGHNQPGGGFIAGLIVAIGFLMQYMASGFAWAHNRARVPYHTLIGMGVVIAGGTGIGAWFAGYPLLTSWYSYYHFPPIEEFELASAIAFDLGVFLTVLGAVMLALYSLSRIARRTGEEVSETAMDYDPSREAPIEQAPARTI